MKGIRFSVRDGAKFHLGAEGSSLNSVFSSDKLFSAIVNCAALLYSPDEVKSLIEASKNGKTVISSLFWGLKISTKTNTESSKNICFFPKPAAPIVPEDKEKYDPGKRKRIENIKYLSEGVFDKVRKGWNGEKEIFDCNLAEFPTIAGDFVLTQKEFGGLDEIESSLSQIDLLRKRSRPRLKIDRMMHKSEDFYYQQEMEIRHHTGEDCKIKPFMFFLYKENLTDKMESAIKLLADEGIGGKRSQGMGFFTDVSEFRKDSFLTTQSKNGTYMTLSAYRPKKSEVNSLVAYNMHKRSGYITSQTGTSFKKPSVRILGEGTVTECNPGGSIQNVTPPQFEAHPVYLNGRCYAVQLKGGQE